MVSGGLRVVFFGTPAFAVPSLEALLASRHAVVAVVTQPDRPRGRGQKVTDGPVKARAAAAGLPVLQPDRLRDPSFVDALARVNADLGVVAAYGKLLTDEVLAIPRLGMINVHGSLLPRYRGAAPVHRAIIEGEEETGVTIMRVVKQLDAGPMLAKAPRAIGADETSEDVERDLARVGASLLISVVDAMAAGAVVATPQDDALATYAHRLKKEDGLIDWNMSAGRIHNLVRGLHPWPHAFTFRDGQRFIIRRTHRPDAASASRHGDEPGTIVAAADEELAVQTGAGAIRILEIQPEGKRPMTVREFLSGHHLAPGARFADR
jgi:methionyl-tRNA formyltransferase